MNARKEPAIDTPYAPKRPSLSKTLAAVDEALQQAASVEAVSDSLVPIPATDEPEFVRLAEKVAEGMNQAAQNALTEAQNLVEQVKLKAQSFVDHVRTVGQEINSLNGRLKGLGGEVISAYDKFNNKPN